MYVLGLGISIIFILVILSYHYRHTIVDNFLALGSNFDLHHSLNGFGNKLFHKLRISIRSKLGSTIIFKYNIRNDIFKDDFEITPSELEQLRKFPDSIYGNNNINSPWLYANWHENDRKYYMPFWKIVRNILNRKYNKVLKDPNIKDPVIHFRCSDIPFNRNNEYHIPNDDMILWVINELKKRKFKKVIILNCTKHEITGENDKYCKIFLDHYVSIFRRENIEINYQCKSLLEDFALMFYTPLLISLNGSSFSFMAGIAKDPNTFISSNNGREKNGKYLLSDTMDWNYFKNPPILHSNVKTYSSSDIFSGDNK